MSKNMTNNTVAPNLLLQVLRSEKNEKVNGGIYHFTQVKLSYNSNRIEGSKLTEDQTEQIFSTQSLLPTGDKKEVIAVDDVVETMNHFRCFDYLLEVVEQDLSLGMLKRLHEILKLGTAQASDPRMNAGDFKLYENFVGNIFTTKPEQVASKLKTLFVSYYSKAKKTFEDIVRFHWEFEKIHPFSDGNGRIGRLLMFKECLRYKITPFIILEEHKLFYYRGLKEFEQDKKYLLDTCLSSQDYYQAMMDKFRIKFR
ncbi:MAG: Fic family protein [Streptococcaceae bacterium]|jgi:Fic family protein|nr:Fic family protein [Streptococcaceae bacterium]